MTPFCLVAAPKFFSSVSPGTQVSHSQIAIFKGRLIQCNKLSILGFAKWSEVFDPFLGAPWNEINSLKRSLAHLEMMKQDRRIMRLRPRGCCMEVILFKNGFEEIIQEPRFRLSKLASETRWWFKLKDLPPLSWLYATGWQSQTIAHSPPKNFPECIPEAVQINIQIYFSQSTNTHYLPSRITPSNAPASPLRVIRPVCKQQRHLSTDSPGLKPYDSHYEGKESKNAKFTL